MARYGSMGSVAYKRLRTDTAMATTKERLAQVVEALSLAGEITTRSMMGEYLVYCNGLYCAGVCNGTLYVKFTDEGYALLPTAPLEPMYEGAKQLCLRIDDLSDEVFLRELIVETCAHLPKPKPKRKPQPRV